jgi:hypothetical protein
MVTSTFEFNQFSLELVKDMGKYLFQCPERILVKNMFPVFGNKHQVNVHVEHTMSTDSDVWIFFHHTLTISQGQ